MATVTWVVLRHHRKADGTYNPKMRIIHNRTTAYMPTQIFTPLVKFKKEDSTGSVTDGDIIDSLNDKVKEIRKILNKYEYIVEDCEDAKTVIHFVDKKLNQDKSIDFIDFAKKYVSGLKDNGSKNVKFSLISNLCKYVGCDNLPVGRLTSSFLNRFESWLRSPKVVEVNGKNRTKRPVSNASIQTYMQALQTIYNKMLLHYNDYETGDIVILGDPFKAYSTRQEFTEVKKAVPAEVVRQIVNYKPEKHKSWCKFIDFARDMFFLSFCLAGMNLADMFTCNTYMGGRIDYRRQKTRAKKKNKAFISVPVIPEIQQTLYKYLDPDKERVFDLHKRFKDIQQARQSLARGMQILCRELEIEPITFYAARHSFATIARNECDVSMDDIALCLTHVSGYNITDTYVKPDFSRVDEVIRKVADYVFGVDGLVE